MNRCGRFCLLVIGMVLAAGLALPGCGAPPEPTGSPSSSTPATGVDDDKAAKLVSPVELADDRADPNGVTGDWVVQRIPVEPGHLNVVLDTADAYSNRIMMYTFESALEQNKATLEPKLMLAESYEVSDDHLVYTYKIRKDAYFSDGQPLTAHDILFTHDAIKNPANETAGLRNYYKDVVKAELIDDYTIQFTCAKPYFRNLLILGGIPVYPKHVYGTGDFNLHPANRKPVGSGPYIFESWETNQQIVFKRNPNYWNKEPKFFPEKMVYKVITDDNSAFQVLERQELDAIMQLQPEQWINQAATPEFEAKFAKYVNWAPQGYLGNYSYVAWNLRKPQFKQKEVRQALTLLFNRQLLVDKIWHGYGKVISGPAFSESPDYDKSIAPWPFDPEAAKAKLDAAGWKDSDTDGVRDKDGVKLSFELMYPPGREEVRQMAVVYKEELAKAGVDLRIREIEWARFIENITKREFDSVTLSWAIPPDSDPYQLWHSSQVENGDNYPGFVSAEMDELVEKIREEFDPEKRSALWHRVHAILHEEQPYTFFMNRLQMIAIAKRFQGVKMYRVGFEEPQWWVPAGQQKYAP
ncbi:MAG: hypothetical protein AMXMBFR84_27160 [Candidatus Hydrogenedentota bacterium]